MAPQLSTLASTATCLSICMIMVIIRWRRPNVPIPLQQRRFRYRQRVATMMKSKRMRTSRSCSSRCKARRCQQKAIHKACHTIRVRIGKISVALHYSCRCKNQCKSRSIHSSSSRWSNQWNSSLSFRVVWTLVKVVSLCRKLKKAPPRPWASWYVNATLKHKAHKPRTEGISKLFFGPNKETHTF